MKTLIDRLLDQIAARVASATLRKMPTPEEPAVRLYGECPTVETSIPAVYLNEGQSLTVFAGPHRKLDSDPPYDQIEIRVTSDGRIELFADGLVPVPWRAWSADGLETGSAL